MTKVQWAWEIAKLIIVLFFAWVMVSISLGCTSMPEDMDEFERQTWEYERLSNMQYFTEACIGAGGIVEVVYSNYRSPVRPAARTVDDLRCIKRR